MNWLDVALIAWWLTAAVTLIPLAIHGTIHLPRARDKNLRATLLASFRGQKVDRYGGLESSPPITSSRVSGYALIVAYSVLFIGLLGFVWMNNWTRLLFFNYQLVGLVFGMACLFLGFSSHFAATSPDWLQKVKRVGSFATGLLMTAGCAYWIFADVAISRLTVEGRIERMDMRYSRGHNYFIYVNGMPYKATREVYLPLHVGDRIRAELSAGSNIIFSAEKL